jgi:hypothetical protein
MVSVQSSKAIHVNSTTSPSERFEDKCIATYYALIICDSSILTPFERDSVGTNRPTATDIPHCFP